MSFNLSEHVVKKLPRQWFHFVRTPDGLIEPTNRELSTLKPDLVQFSVHADFVPRRDMTRMQEQSVIRHATNQKGRKAFKDSETSLREDVCLRVVKDWKMTGKGLKTINAEVKYDNGDGKSGIRDDTVIEFSEANMVVLVGCSNFSTYIYGLATNFDKWFGPPEDEDDDEGGDEGGDDDDDDDEGALGNSSSGRGSSSAKRAAETASPNISATTAPR